MGERRTERGGERERKRERGKGEEKGGGREREIERECVSVCVREMNIESVCVCVCERECAADTLQLTLSYTTQAHIEIHVLTFLTFCSDRLLS